MTVTISTVELADRIRVDGATEEPILSNLTELREVGKAQVETFAPDAPDAVHNLACALWAGYIYDKPTSGQGTAYAVAMVNSGAASLLSPWYSGISEVRNPGDAVPNSQIDALGRL